MSAATGHLVLGEDTFPILKDLGPGTFGHSYLTEQGGMPTVVKVFDVHYTEVFKRRAHQYRESGFSSTATLVGYSNIGITNEMPWVTRAYVEGTRFDDFARAFLFDSKNPHQAVELGEKLCRGLAPLHSAGMVHGHAWNPNVFFNHYGDPIITDPYIGAPTPQYLTLTSTPLPRLSLHLAPEQRDVNGVVDPRTDVWHIGMLLCRLITAKPDLAINDRVLMQLTKTKVPLSLIRVLWNAVHPEPASRFRDLATLEVALSEVFQPEHARTVYVRPLPYAPGVKDGWDRPIKKLVLGLGSILLMVAAGYAFLSRDEPTNSRPLAVAPPPPAPASKPTQPSALAYPESYLRDQLPHLPLTNQRVVQTLLTYPRNGEHDYWWPRRGEGVAYDGSTTDVMVNEITFLRGEARGRTFSPGLTLEVALRAIQQDANELPQFTAQTLPIFKKLWFVEKPFAPAPADALLTFGMGKAIDNVTDALPGDFVQLWRRNKSGHSVIFIDWIRNPGGHIAGIYYWGTQASTKGIGFNQEMFGQDGKSIDATFFKPARIAPAPEWKVPPIASLVNR